MRKCRFLIVFILVTVFVFSFSVSAAVNYPVDAPYHTYIYNTENEPVAIPSAFSVERVVTGRQVSALDFNSLSDIYYNGNGQIFICDSGNSRVLITDLEFHTLAVVSEFTLDGTTSSLLNPQGVWADEHLLYIADTGNHRIVVFEIDSQTVTAKKVFDQPEISVLEENFEYSPGKLTVDATQKMYVIAAGINQGIICLNENGEFQSFLGAPKVEPNFFEAI